MIPGARCRPISQWPGTLSRSRRRSQFRAAWSRTVEIIQKELRAIHARNIVLEMALTEREIVLDGSRPKATARPEHPGVVLSCESRVGPLRFSCDRFLHWNDNIHAIALGLEALRKVDRYGITKRGEQYAGWKALPAATNGVETRQQAIEILADAAAVPYPEASARLYATYKAALLRAHPDHGGTSEAFIRVRDAWTFLQANV